MRRIPRTHRLTTFAHVPSTVPDSRRHLTDTTCPGGLPPVAYRSSTAKWGEACPNAPEPFASRAVRGEVKSGIRHEEHFSKGR